MGLLPPGQGNEKQGRLSEMSKTGQVHNTPVFGVILCLSRMLCVYSRLPGVICGVVEQGMQVQKVRLQAYRGSRVASHFCSNCD